MQIEEYVWKKYDEFWKRDEVPDSDKVNAMPLLKDGYEFIARKIKDHHKELTPDAVRDIGILEGFLITFIQHASDKEQLNKMGAIIG